MAAQDDAYDAFADLIDGEMLLDIVEAEIYEWLLSGVTGITREQALRVAKEEAGRLIQDITEGTRQGLAKIIADGLEQQIGVDGIAANIVDQIGLNPQRLEAVAKYRAELEKQGLSQSEIDAQVAKFIDQQIRERAELIATTEAANAISKGEDEVMRERGAQFKAWITSGDSLVSDECKQCEADGWIPVDEAFSTGAMLPPDNHPGCRCSATYRTELTDEAIQRQKDRSDKTADATAA